MSRMTDRLLKESTAPCEHAPQYVQVLRHASLRRSRKMGAYPNAPDMHLCKAGCLFLLILLLLARLSVSLDVRRNTTIVLGFTHQDSAHRLPAVSRVVEQLYHADSCAQSRDHTSIWRLSRSLYRRGLILSMHAGEPSFSSAFPRICRIVCASAVVSVSEPCAVPFGFVKPFIDYVVDKTSPHRRSCS
jgi:hypothetical protein